MNKLKEKLLQKSNLWHVGAIAAFLVISTAYLHPALSGYNVDQGDVRNWIGASQEIKDYYDNEGQIGWTNAMFSGMPSIQIDQHYDGLGLMTQLRSAMTLWLPRPISQVFLYFLGFYFMAISFRVKPLVAAVGALAFGFSSSHIIIIEAGHITKANAIGFVPFVIAGFNYVYRWKNWILAAGLMALFVSFELQCNHLQITYYSLFIMLGLGIAELARTASKEKSDWLRFGKSTAAVIGAALIAFMINSGNILGTQEYGQYTTRGGTELTVTADGSSNDSLTTTGLDREYITAWSYGRSETFTFIVPNFKGGETQRIGDNEANDKIVKGIDGGSKQFVKGQNQYFGEQPFTSGPVYLGIIVVFLALLGIVYSKKKVRWALLSVALLTVFLSWGKNFVSALVILPALGYIANIFLTKKKMLIFSAINTAVLLVVISQGHAILDKSLTDFFLDVLPGYDKFRAVTIILAVAQLCVPLLGVFFLHSVIKNRKSIRENLMPFWIVSGFMGFLMIVFLLAPGMANSFITTAEEAALEGITDGPTYDYYADMFNDLGDARASIFKKDALRSFGLLILAFGAVFVFIRDLINEKVFIGILAVLVLIDMVGIDTRYLNTAKKGRNYEQWTETWKQKYPYTAGNGDLEIFNKEAQANPNILLAVDSAMNTVDFSEMEGPEKKRVQDWLTFRTLNRYTNYRVFDFSNPFNSSYASYFHKSIGGYHGAKLGRYQELIEFHIGKNNPAVLDMLNTKYSIASSMDQSGNMNSQFVKENPGAMGNAWFTKGVKYVENADEEILALNSQNVAKLTIGSSPYPVLVNGQVASGEMVVTGLESVAFVAPMPQADGSMAMDTVPQQLPVAQAEAFDLSLVPMETPGQWHWAYDAMLDSSFLKIMTLTTAGRQGWDPVAETVVDKRFAENISQETYTATGTINMISYHPDELKYKFNSSDTQLVVFSEIYYPESWKAFIDGKETPISRVNYTLRAVEVPAGEHTIEMVYESEVFKTAGTLAMVGSGLIVLMIGFGIYMETRRKEDADDEGDEDDEDDGDPDDLGSIDDDLD